MQVDLHFFSQGLGWQGIRPSHGHALDRGSHILAALLDRRLQNLVLCRRATSFRYDTSDSTDLLKDFSVLIYLYGGARVLNFLLANGLFGALPGPDTAKKWMMQRCPSILRESGLSVSRMDSVPIFFETFGAVSPVYHLSHDATAVLPRIRWRRPDNALLGFVVSDAELPYFDCRAPESFSELEEFMDKYRVATQAEIFVLQSMDPRLPTLVLAVFAQSGPADAGTTKSRIATIVQRLAAVGCYIMSWAADGAAANSLVMTEHWAMRGCNFRVTDSLFIGTASTL